MIWEMATGNELAYLPTGTTWQVLFQPSGDLLTSGFYGLMRWRIRPNPDREEEYQIGPPELLVRASTDGLVQSADGRTVVVAISGAGSLVVDLDHPGATKPHFPHAGNNKVAVSPNGHWAATGCFHGTGIKVWSVRQKALVKELPIEGSASPYFSPDGQWLATMRGADFQLQLWKIGTWERGPRLPDGYPVFSPDGRFVAVLLNQSVRLIDLDSGVTVATLDDPNADRPNISCFSHDGCTCW